MRTYLILKEKAKQWNADKEVRQILKQIETESNDTPTVKKFSRKDLAALVGYSFDKAKIAKKRLPYERLDQITVDILLGVR
jgi:xylose isomerase